MDPTPCPYATLGLAKDCKFEDIKKAYKKLALRLHPDKAATNNLTTEEAHKKFQDIGAAYALIGTEEDRAKYDAEQTLEALRKAKMGSGGGVDVKTARYETRTAAPAGATFTTNGPPRYEERRPPYDDRKPSSRMYDEERYYEGRKYETYEAVPRSARRCTEKESQSRSDKATSDRTRSERAKTRDKAERRDRRFYGPEEDSSGSDEKHRRERELQRRAEQSSRKQADARRKDERRSYEDVATKEREREREREPRRHRSNEEHLDRARQTSEKYDDAVRYIYRTKVEDARPPTSRTSSTRDALPLRDDYDRSRRPETVRRSSARPSKDRTSSSSARDRTRLDSTIPIMDWPRDEPPPRMPAFKQSTSSPADIHIPPPRATPQRSQTEQYPDRRIRVDTSPSPATTFRRAETMPTAPFSTQYRTLSGTASAFPTVPPPTSSSRSGTTKTYYYPITGAGVQRLPAEQVDLVNGRRTVIREPGQSSTHSSPRHRSPSPLARPPIGANRPSEPAISSRSAGPPPPLGRSSSYADERGRSGRMSDERSRAGRPFYREMMPDQMHRERVRQGTHFPSESVSYAKSYRPEDVQFAESRDRGLERAREYGKPTLGRHATYVC